MQTSSLTNRVNNTINTSKIADRSVLDTRQRISKASLKRLPSKMSSSLDYGDKLPRQEVVSTRLTLNEYDFQQYNSSKNTILVSTRNVPLKPMKIKD